MEAICSRIQCVKIILWMQEWESTQSYAQDGRIEHKNPN